MEPLDTKDLQRFKWDKMSPAIHKKIKAKKRLLFLKSLLGVVSSALFISLIMWTSNPEKLTQKTISLTDKVDSEIVQTMDTQAKPEYLKVRSFEQADEIVANENAKSSIKRNEVLVSIEESMAIESDQLLSKGFAKIVNDQNPINTQLGKVPRKDVEHIEMESISRSRTLNKLFKQFPLLSSVRDTIKNEDSCAMEFKLQDSTSNESSAIELAFNLNTAYQHPHTSLVGTGGNIGYNVGLGKSYYVGFEFAYQRLKYRFDYSGSNQNESFGVIEVLLDTLNNVEVQVLSTFIEGTSREIRNYNNHDLYSVPIFIGRQFNLSKTKFSVETGLNLSLIKFSDGIVNSPSNSNAMIEIKNSTLFRKNVGASLILRAKFVYPVGKNFSLFSRIGTDVMLRNWYTNQDHTLKPQIINWDIGIRKSF